MKAKIFNGLAFLKQVTIQKLINFIKVRFSYLLSIIIKKPITWGFPYSISIEPVSVCNLHCPECPTGTKTLNRPGGVMNFQIFQKIIDSLHKNLLFNNLYFQGEPFLNPSFFEFIGYASKKNIYTGTSTNGHFLNAESSLEIVRSGLDSIIISLDGTEQESYASYRIGGNLELVLNGIKSLVLAKKSMKSAKPYVIIQFLVLKTNEHQMDEMKKLSKKLEVDELQFKSAQFYDFENGNCLIPNNVKFSRYKKMPDGNWKLKKTILNRCYKMWHAAVFTWNGDVVPCCFDKNADFNFGNIQETAFEKIWNSIQYNKFRSTILKNRKNIYICKNCSE